MATTQLFTTALRNNSNISKDNINHYPIYSSIPSTSCETTKIASKRVGSSLSDSNDQKHSLEPVKNSCNNLLVPNYNKEKCRKKKLELYRKSAANLFESFSSRGSLEKIKGNFLFRNHTPSNNPSLTTLFNSNENEPTTIYSAISPSTSSYFQQIPEVETCPVLLIYEIHRNGFRIADLNTISSVKNNDLIEDKSNSPKKRIKPFLTKFSPVFDEAQVISKRFVKQDPARALLAFSKSFKKIKRARTIGCNSSKKRRKQIEYRQTQIGATKSNKLSQSLPSLRPTALCELFYLYLRDLNSATVKIEKEFLNSYDHSKLCICCKSVSSKYFIRNEETSVTSSLLQPFENSKGKRSSSLISYTNEQKQHVNCLNRKELLQNYNKVRLSELYRRKQIDKIFEKVNKNKTIFF